MLSSIIPARQLPPVEEAPGEYDLRALSAPAISGAALRAFLYMLEGPAGNLIIPLMLWKSGVTQVLHGVVAADAPVFLPELPVKRLPAEEGCAPLEAFDTPDAAVSCALGPAHLVARRGSHGEASVSSKALPTVRDYLAAYSAGTATPTEVMRRIVDFIRASEARSPEPCAWLVAWDEADIMRQAEASNARYAAGTARPLEGVPFCVKDVMDAKPYPTTAGTSFLAQRRPVHASAPMVSALQDMGAVLLGKSNLHEIGLGVTGLNVRTGTPLNPWAATPTYTGGSSSGSAAAIAAGLCPIAIGSDGGGSIRLPAAFCGIAGLKPTTGRVSGSGGVEIDCTVATFGPLGGTVEDVALLYASMANQDGARSVWGEKLPPPALPSPLPSDARGDRPLEGVRIGVFSPWFDDCDDDVRSACRAGLDAAVAAGAQLVDVTVPELELIRVAHTVTIASEMHNCMQCYWDEPATRAQFNGDVRLALGTVRYWTSADYLTAQRIRARGTAHFKRILADVHMVATPTAPITAPAIPPSAASGGASDLVQTSTIMRFAPSANLIGLPAISVPVGLDSSGLPIGMQFMGRAWTEASLLRVGAVVEGACWADVRSNDAQPAMWINPLTGERAGL